MSTDNTTMLTLLKQQEQQRRDLAAGTYKAWHTLQQAENNLLAPYDGHYSHAPQSVKNTVDKARAEFWKEWGSEGRLSKMLEKKHERERERLVQQNQKFSPSKEDERIRLLKDVRAKRDAARSRSSDRERGG